MIAYIWEAYNALFIIRDADNQKETETKAAIVVTNPCLATIFAPESCKQDQEQVKANLSPI